MPPQYYPYAQMQDDEIDLFQLFMVIVRYWWLILIIVGVSLVGSVFYVKTLPSYYKAKAVVFSPAKSTGGNYQSALSSIGMGSLLGADSTPVDIIIKMLTSRRMTKEMITQFDLIPYYSGRISKQAFAIIPGISRDDSAQLWSGLAQSGYITPEGYTTQKAKGMLVVPYPFDKQTPYIMKILSIAQPADQVKPNKKTVITTNSNDRAQAQLDDTIKAFQGSFSVEKDKSAFVTLAFEDRNPLLAAQIVNQCVANLDRLNETLGITAQKPLVIVMDGADVPTTKSKPNKKMVIMIAGLSSLLGSIFLAFLIDYIRTLVKK